VVNSTDGVSGYQGEEGNHNHQALQTSHDCSAFYFEIFRPLRLEAADWLLSGADQKHNDTPHIISDISLPQTMALVASHAPHQGSLLLDPICCINKVFADSLAGA